MTEALPGLVLLSHQTVMKQQALRSLFSWSLRQALGMGLCVGSLLMGTTTAATLSSLPTSVPSLASSTPIESISLESSAPIQTEKKAISSNPDPWESWNRKVYRFNDTVDKAVLKPLAQGYQAITPQPVRNGVSRFFSHWGSLWSLVNSALQGRGDEALQTWMRFNVNLFFGLGGFLDPATEMGLVNARQDFGLTLAHWGVPKGPYLVLPLFGPTTLRDSTDWGFLSIQNPAFNTHDVPTRNSALGLRLVDMRAQLLSVTDTVNAVALDPYRFVRDGYLQRRQALVGQGSASATRVDLPFDSFDEEVPSASDSPGTQKVGSVASGSQVSSVEGQSVPQAQAGLNKPRFHSKRHAKPRVTTQRVSSSIPLSSGTHP